MDIFEEDINSEIVHTIKGTCVGIVLTKRGNNDPHICWQLIVEDDENWYIQRNSFSSFWILDLKMVISQMEEWLENNAEKEEYFGWRMKEVRPEVLAHLQDSMEQNPILGEMLAR